MKTTLLSLTASLMLALLGARAQAQQPASPAPTTSPSAAPAPAPANEYLLGRVYRVETMQGTIFTGTLVNLGLETLEFDVPEMGKISLARTQIRRADLQGPVTAGVKPGYFDIGNGSRLFFAPTGRGLRRGENTLQSVNLFLLGANFGVTDYFSLGGYVSVLPGVSIDEQFLALTPKFSFPINEKLHVGAGLLYIRAPNFDSNSSGGTGLGIGYGAFTVGSADNNFTVGLGYGFVEGEIGSTPVIQVGGQTRVSRRISLITENYVFANERAGLGGLYGMKINWSRVSLGLGAMYVYTFEHETNYGNGGTYTQGGSGFTTYILPVYYDVTFRFGKAGK